MPKITLTHPWSILRLTLMPVKLDGEPQKTPIHVGGSSLKMMRPTALTNSNY